MAKTKPEPPPDDVPLHLRYRPTEFEEVIGQEAVIKALKYAIEGKRPPHSYLFLGPSGCGKTTLARIVARKVGCAPVGILEVDGAMYSRVEEIRAVVESMEFRTISEHPEKAAIIDECHRLSPAAWASLLKAVEEPRKHAYWLLCTTAAEKVPETIRTRCHTVEIRRVSKSLINDYLDVIADVEEMDLDPKIIEFCAREAYGSVRQALVYLTTVSGCKSLDEAKTVLLKKEQESDLGIFMKQLCGGTLRWKDAVYHLGKLQDEDPEGIRLSILSYAQKVLLNSKSLENSARLLNILNAFIRPCNRSERMAPLLTAVGGLLNVENPGTVGGRGRRGENDSSERETED